MDYKLWEGIANQHIKDISNFIIDQMDKQEKSGMIITREIIEQILKDLTNRFNDTKTNS